RIGRHHSDGEGGRRLVRSAHRCRAGWRRLSIRPARWDARSRPRGPRANVRRPRAEPPGGPEILCVAMP
ncbi:MAG TPA: hypothetical protein DDW48_01990, partial [Methyloceanibacter sp.]|nr:hypothetical protein [Methyloceanibacter sp.]